MDEKPSIKQRRRPPVRVDEQVLEDALVAIAAGRTLTAFCAEPGRPARQSVCRVIAEDPEWCERFRLARELGFDALAEECLALADAPLPVDENGRADPAVAHQRRLQVDTRLRLLSKWATSRYGDRLQVANAGVTIVVATGVPANGASPPQLEDRNEVRALPG